MTEILFFASSSLCEIAFEDSELFNNNKALEQESDSFFCANCTVFHCARSAVAGFIVSIHDNNNRESEKICADSRHEEPKKPDKRPETNRFFVCCLSLCMSQSLLDRFHKILHVHGHLVLYYQFDSD